MRQAAEAAHFGSYSYDIERGVVEWSPELYAIHGLSPGEELTLERIEQQIHREDRENFREYVARSLKLPEHEEYEGLFRIVLPDGQVRWIADRGQILHLGKGKSRKPHRAVGMVFDVTEQRRAEEQLRQLNESLEQHVAQRTGLLRMRQEITRAANEARTIEEAMAAALESLANYNGWQIGHAWRLAEDSQELVSFGTWHVMETADQITAFQQICEQIRITPEDRFIGKVLKTGEPQWIDDIQDSTDSRRSNAQELGLHATIAFPIFADSEVVAVMEFFSDHPALRDERFMDVMLDVGIQLGHVIQRKQLERDVADTAEYEQRRLGNDIHDGVGQEITGLKFIASACADIYRIIQEAVNNAVKHAQAHQITIQLSEGESEYTRQVIDDGTGMALDQKPGGSFGLRSMRYRADLIGANLVIVPGENRGTVVRLQFRK